MIFNPVVQSGGSNFEYATVTCQMTAPGEFYVAYFDGTQTLYETISMGQTKELQVPKESFVVSRYVMGASGNLEELEGTQLSGVTIYIVHGDGRLSG